MGKLIKFAAAYLALLIFYQGDFATTTLMAFMIGGLYGCWKIDKMEEERR